MVPSSAARPADFAVNRKASDRVGKDRDLESVVAVYGSGLAVELRIHASLQERTGLGLGTLRLLAHVGF